MARRIKLTLAIAVAIGAILGFLGWRASDFSGRELMSTLPTVNASLFYADTATLRKAGILELIAGAKTNPEEPEYRSFVEQTGFNYRTDLDTIAASFSAGRNFFALRGRFQWGKLTAYAISQQGECHDSICTMPASTAGRSISFYLLKPSVLALAVAPEPRAVTMITSPDVRRLSVFYNDPVWFWTTASAMRETQGVAGAARMLAADVTQTESIVLAGGPLGDSAQLRMEVACKTAESAASLAKTLTTTTGMLKAGAKSDPMSLAALLAQGNFSQKSTVVTANWPVSKPFLEALAAANAP